MAVAEQIRDAVTSPAEVARQALTDAKGDVVRATELMVGRVLRDQTLYRQLLDPLARTACYDVIRQICRSDRRAIWNSAQPSTDDQRARVIALAGGVRASLMDFPLPGGLRLGDAQRADLSAAAAFFSRQATDMGRKARWLGLIAQSLPDEKSVSEVLTDARLSELKAACTDE